MCIIDLLINVFELLSEPKSKTQSKKGYKAACSSLPNGNDIGIPSPSTLITAKLE
jgi:hypothetical protein